MAAAAKAKKLDYKCLCTCRSQEGSEKAQRNLPLVHRTNKQDFRAEPLATKQFSDAGCATKLTNLLPCLIQYSCCAGRFRTETSTYCGRKLYASSTNTSAGIVVPSTDDIEAAEIMGISPATAKVLKERHQNLLRSLHINEAAIRYASTMKGLANILQRSKALKNQGEHGVISASSAVAVRFRRRIPVL